MIQDNLLRQTWPGFHLTGITVVLQDNGTSIAAIPMDHCSMIVIPWLHYCNIRVGADLQRTYSGLEADLQRSKAFSTRCQSSVIGIVSQANYA
jgi:hypothetical protein